MGLDRKAGDCSRCALAIDFERDCSTAALALAGNPCSRDWFRRAAAAGLSIETRNSRTSRSRAVRDEASPRRKANALILRRPVRPNDRLTGNARPRRSGTPIEPWPGPSQLFARDLVRRTQEDASRKIVLVGFGEISLHTCAGCESGPRRHPRTLVPATVTAPAERHEVGHGIAAAILWSNGVMHL